MNRRLDQRRRPAAAAIAFTLVVAAMSAAGGQDPVEIRGAAILEHPAGALAVKAAELLTAGKIDDVIRLRTASEQADWKSMSAADRKEMGARLKERSPSPAALADGIRNGGTLTIDGTSAMLKVEGPGGLMIASFERAGGNWQLANGPMVLGGSAAPAAETRIEGAELVGHPVAAVALRYVELVHAGRMDEAMRLASADARQRWKEDPPAERAESLAYLRKTLPTAAAMKSSLAENGLLIVEGNTRATLNVITKAQRSSSPGAVDASATTVAMGFVFEEGAWKVSR